MSDTAVQKQALKELVDFVIVGTQVGFDVAKDGKLDLNDLSAIYKLVPYIGPFVGDIKNIPSAFKDMDANDAAELLAYVGTKLVVDNAKAQIIIDHSLKIAGKVYEIVVEAKAMKAELNALAAAAAPAPAPAPVAEAPAAEAPAAQ